MDINKYYVKLKDTEAVFERLNYLVNLSLGAVNTIAGRTLYDACEMLAKDKSVFRFTVKKTEKKMLPTIPKRWKHHVSLQGGGTSANCKRLNADWYILMN